MAKKIRHSRSEDWRPLVPAHADQKQLERIAKELGLDHLPDVGDLFVNDRYQVAVRRTAGMGSGAPPMVHLSIKRLDRRPIHDWPALQRIKNELLGDEVEAVELYPAESRRVDVANQYHLWAVDDPDFRWPIGFPNGGS